MVTHTSVGPGQMQGICIIVGPGQMQGIRIIVGPGQVQGIDIVVGPGQVQGIDIIVGPGQVQGIDIQVLHVYIYIRCPERVGGVPLGGIHHPFCPPGRPSV